VPGSRDPAVWPAAVPVGSCRSPGAMRFRSGRRSQGAIASCGLIDQGLVRALPSSTRESPVSFAAGRWSSTAPTIRDLVRLRYADV